MQEELGTPWHFASKYPSPNGEIMLEYGMVGEVAMGAPLSGECFLNKNGEQFKLEGMFGGPVIWRANSEMAALPYWTPRRFQKLAIIDIVNMKLLLSEKTYRVIQLQEFKDNLILGIDSPIYRTEKIVFDLNKEKYSLEGFIK